MPDAAAEPFLNAIKASPEDDAPRLVFADWLDENAGTATCGWCRGTGEDRPPQPVEAGGKRFVYTGPLGPCPKCKGGRTQSDGRRERAELIRGQCEFARLGRRMRELRGCGCTLPGHVPLYGDPEVVRCDWCLAIDWRRKWERKQQAIGVAATTAFCPPGEWAAGEVPVFEFDRGFIRSVAAPWASWLRAADHLLAREWVPRVVLTTWPKVNSRDLGEGDVAYQLVGDREWIDDWKVSDPPGVGAVTTPDWLTMLLAVRWPQVGQWDLTSAVTGPDVREVRFDYGHVVPVGQSVVGARVDGQASTPGGSVQFNTPIVHHATRQVSVVAIGHGTHQLECEVMTDQGVLVSIPGSVHLA